MDVWDKLCALEQLRLKFGADFWAKVSQQIRRDRNTSRGTATHLPVYTSRQSGRDLREFCRSWGIAVSATADRTITEAGLPDFERSECAHLHE